MSPYLPSDKPPRVDLAGLVLFVGPDSLLHERLMTEIEDNGLVDDSDAILQVAREAVRLDSTEPDDYTHPGNSRLGGHPDLTDAAFFPQDDDGLYWNFLAQINLAEFAPFNAFLPRSGLLSFFLHSTETLKARVLLYEGDFAALTTIHHGGGDEMTTPNGDCSESPHRVSFERFVSLPHNPPDLNGEEAIDAYETCRSVLESGVHCLNGNTYSEFDSPQEQAASERGGQPEEWVPLLHLGWDGNVGYCFGDAGKLTFCIHQEDLRRCDFSRVHVSLEG